MYVKDKDLHFDFEICAHLCNPNNPTYRLKNKCRVHHQSAKVFFDRTKDWADLEDMYSAGQLDVQFVAGVISHYLGPDDPRLKRLFAIAIN